MRQQVLGILKRHSCNGVQCKTLAILHFSLLLHNKKKCTGKGIIKTHSAQNYKEKKCNTIKKKMLEAVFTSNFNVLCTLCGACSMQCTLSTNLTNVGNGPGVRDTSCNSCAHVQQLHHQWLSNGERTSTCNV